jgi:hypothetical protein
MKFTIIGSCWRALTFSAFVPMLCLAHQPILLPQGIETRQDAKLEQVLAVDDATLASLRGGFDWGQGLRVSFGLVRTVAINGELVHTTRLYVPDMAGMVQKKGAIHGHSSDLPVAPNLVQIGSNNMALLSEGVQAATTIVQNSLNNQQISTLTEINTVVNSLSLIQSLNARATMQEALLGGLGVR